MEMLMKLLDAEDIAQTELQFDKEISIAVALSRQSKKWQNKSLTVSDFIKTLSVTKRTDETIDEYLAMGKGEQDEIKDSNGAFVGAMLKGGRRRKRDVANRTCLTMDLDYAAKGTADIIKKELRGIGHTVYSTHKNQPHKPRLRLLIWPDRVMLKDEYEAVVRRLADKIGIEAFDTSGFDINRLYYNPTTSSDAEFVFYHNDAPFLPVDQVLAAYGPDDAWKNTLLWARSSRETKSFDRMMKKQADPLKKKGIIGAFCRIVPLKTALSEYLGDIYRKEGKDRYTYIEGTSTNGLVVYGELSFSNHASDPAHAQCCNAFDLLRIHKFSHLDDKAKVGTATHKLPSYREMMEFARDIPAVKTDLVKSKLEVDVGDFDVFDEDDEGEVGEEGAGRVVADWEGKLQAKESGEIKPTFFNAVMILKHDPVVNRRMRFNEFSLNVESVERGEGENWGSADSYAVREYVGGKYIVDIPELKIEQAIENNALRNRYHPVRKYLEGLVWDGVGRIETLFIDYFGCPDNVYSREVAQCWFSAAVHRIFEPGYKFDTALVISGEQGIGKTMFIRELGLRKWYGELSSFDPKIAMEEIAGKWIVEINEMGATNKQDLERQKSFLSASATRVRMSYGRHPTDFKRQQVFFGSTNRSEYLKDSTGNRRWWPLNATKKSVDIAKLRAEVDQIWAEAYASLWVQSKKVYLSNEATKVALEVQEHEREEDEWVGMIDAWLEKDAYHDRYDSTEQFDTGNLVHRDRVCRVEIWEDCLNMKQSIRPSDRARIGQIMKDNSEWKKFNSIRFGKRYGRQRGWKKEVPF